MINSLITLKYFFLRILIISTLYSLLSDISIANFSLFWLAFSFYIYFFIPFISTLVCLPLACEREQDIPFCSVGPLACLQWFRWGTECAVLQDRLSVIPWCGSTLFHLSVTATKGPAQSLLTDYSCLRGQKQWLTIAWEWKRQRRGRVQMVNRPDYFC